MILLWPYQALYGLLRSLLLLYLLLLLGPYLALHGMVLYHPEQLSQLPGHSLVQHDRAPPVLQQEARPQKCQANQQLLLPWLQLLRLR
mmetsp:Transcript_15394/g.41638  ORF Transcript_15394/g.41638 Transcript_15394/m.41638 type:complete len:88 (+) Transcript_15394:1054-1317(+)